MQWKKQHFLLFSPRSAPLENLLDGKDIIVVLILSRERKKLTKGEEIQESMMLFWMFVYSLWVDFFNRHNTKSIAQDLNPLHTINDIVKLKALA